LFDVLDHIRILSKEDLGNGGTRNSMGRTCC
jgi:hypothetical protein